MFGVLGVRGTIFVVRLALGVGRTPDSFFRTLICSMIARPVGLGEVGHFAAMVSALTLVRMLGLCSMSFRRSWVDISWYFGAEVL